MLTYISVLSFIADFEVSIAAYLTTKACLSLIDFVTPFVQPGFVVEEWVRSHRQARGVSVDSFYSIKSECVVQALTRRVASKASA